MTMGWVGWLMVEVVLLVEVEVILVVALVEGSVVGQLGGWEG